MTEKISPGMEWVVNNLQPINELHPALCKKRGDYFEFIVKIVKECHTIPTCKVRWTSDFSCLLEVFLQSSLVREYSLTIWWDIYGTNLFGCYETMGKYSFWTNQILFERSNNLLPKITCFYNCLPITHVSTPPLHERRKKFSSLEDHVGQCLFFSFCACQLPNGQDCAWMCPISLRRFWIIPS